MYSLKGQFDEQTLVSKTLVQVCFSKYQSWLHFSEDISIQVDGEFSCDQAGVQSSGNTSENLKRLLDSIESTVVTARIENETELVLVLENDVTINFFSDPNFESYHIVTAGKTITV